MSTYEEAIKVMSKSQQSHGTVSVVLQGGCFLFRVSTIINNTELHAFFLFFVIGVSYHKIEMIC